MRIAWKGSGKVRSKLHIDSRSRTSDGRASCNSLDDRGRFRARRTAKPKCTQYLIHQTTVSSIIDYQLATCSLKVTGISFNPTTICDYLLCYNRTAARFAAEAIGVPILIDTCQKSSESERPVTTSTC